MAMDNRLFYGDNLDVMRKYIGDETIDLCYIDPPFNSSRNYNQIYNNIGQEDAAQSVAFVDTWIWDEAAEEGLAEIRENAGKIYTTRTMYLIAGLEKVLRRGSMLAYIISLTRRASEIRRVLKPAGSFYLHCDPTASHYLKMMLDGVFCPGGGEFLSEIIWKRTSAHNSVKRWGPVHDVILFYSKSDKHTWNPVFSEYSKEYLKKNYRHKDERGVYQLDNLTGAGAPQGEYQFTELTGPGIRHGASGLPWRGVDPTPKKRHWAVPTEQNLPEWLELPDDYDELGTIEKLDALDELGMIYWPDKGGKSGVPRFKRYLDVDGGVAIQDVITDIGPISSRAKERLGYPTQKPEALLERIISTSSNEGDTVLDAYCGCGTTVAVAQRLGRKWIGVDVTYQSISLILKRLEDTYGAEVFDKLEVSGIPRDRESALALANRKDDKTRKEFEKWAILTYSNNRAMINEKKGADEGIDGIAFIMESDSAAKEILFSVKSGKIGPAQVRELLGAAERENAAAAILITMFPPTPAMLKEAARAGKYQNSLMSIGMDKLKIVTVDEIIAGERMKAPLSPEVVKGARRNFGFGKGKSKELDFG